MVILEKKDLITALKGDKQQRYKVIYNRLNNIPNKAGIHCFFIAAVHRKARSFQHCYLSLYHFPLSLFLVIYRHFML